ncbi:MAG: carboxypeptidase-like regulatory domain-containing protein [Planctomycetota bacterium]|nr:carboxypeptidase-like regulatory domain-containing protein [Planctomycetota bacterium]
MDLKKLTLAAIMLAALALGAWFVSPSLFELPGATGNLPAESGQDDENQAPLAKELTDTSEDRTLKKSDPKNGGAGKRVELTILGVVRSRKGTPLHLARVEVGKSFVTTEADGSFTLSLSYRHNKAPKRFRILASASGYSAKETRRPGDKLDNIEITLDRAATVVGQVVDPKNHGIADAQVWALKGRGASVTTDTEGFFRIDLDAKMPRHYLQARAKGFIDSGLSLKTEEIDAENPTILVLKRGAGVYGIVFGLAGPSRDPVEGAALQLTGGKAKTNLEITSDSHGAFAFTGAAPGQQTLTVQHELFAPVRLQVVVPAVGESLEVRIELPPGDYVSGSVQNTNGDAIGKATITILTGKAVVARVTTDKTGRFKTNALPIGADLALIYRAPGYKAPAPSTVRAGQRDLLLIMNRSVAIAGTVIQENGTPVQEFQARILPAKSIGSQKGGGKRKGRGDGSKKIAINKAAYAKANAVGKFGRWGSRKFYNENGHFEISGGGLNEDAAVDLEIKAEGFATRIVEGLVARLDPQPTDHRITLGVGVSLRCIVLTTTGQPVEGAKVQIIPPNNSQRDPKALGNQGGDSDTTDKQGLAQFDHVAGGELKLRINSSVSQLFLHTLQIPEGSTEWQETIRLYEQGSLQGIVHDDRGQPNSGVWVKLSVVEVPGLSQNSWHTKTAPDGSFKFRDLPLGVYRVASLLKDAADDDKKSFEHLGRYVTITGQDPIKVTLTADGVASLSGTGAAESGILGRGLIHLRPLGDEEVDWGQRRASRYGRGRDGSFSMKNIALGRYEIITWWHNQTTGRWLRGAKEISVTKSGEMDLGVIEAKTVPGK